MVLFSDIQAISQKEIHRVIGLERLVNFDDRASLPYVEALYREAPRWRPVIALGLAHAASSDDLYKGYYIPKGANVLYNIWEITHNQERYPDQNTFKPSRFFNANGELNNNTVISAFGLGRRICLGRHVASDTVWLTIATVLQNLRIRKKQDANSEEIPVSGKYDDGMIKLIEFCNPTILSGAIRELHHA